ncbi:MAG: UDP-glucuronic acid decarboxylase family protein [Acidimicrobiia bacterium]
MTRRVLVTGGAGFIGSHLCRTLMARGDEVVAVDDCSTGRPSNLADLEGRPGFSFLVHDVTRPLAIDGPLDAVCHLASAASPPDYLARPLETLLVGSEGTRLTLELAGAKGARYLLTSTSEVYGDPLVHPQPETYWGNVNPVGPRSVYDEAKRFAEALTTAHGRVHGTDVKIARTFNTYGPHLRPGDGRVVSNFIVQALAGKPITVYGDGSQSRSFCYVDDQIAGLCALLDSDWTGSPVNIGNPDEHTVLELAKLVIDMTGSDSDISFEPLPQDDPTRRQPDISLAEKVLNWRPQVGLAEGLARTVEWFRRAVSPHGLASG